VARRGVLCDFDLMHCPGSTAPSAHFAQHWHGSPGSDPRLQEPHGESGLDDIEGDTMAGRLLECKKVCDNRRSRLARDLVEPVCVDARVDVSPRKGLVTMTIPEIY